ERDHVLHRSWHVGDSDDPTPRHRAYRSLCQLFKTMDGTARTLNLERLFSYVGYSQHARPSHRILSESEVIELSKSELIEIGAHTVTHPMLSELSIDQQRAEIRSSKQMLEEMIGRRVSSFAYPYGTTDSYTAGTVASVREAGF